jgi:Sugar (pentulose and hexulose) kinases
VQGAGSGLAKALWLIARHPQARRVCTQADWLASTLLGAPAPCDEQNALKLGYDPAARVWPEWLAWLDIVGRLPTVVPAGTTLGWMPPEVLQRLGWSAPTRLLAGTTDSTAAVLVVEPLDVDTGVTVLGSTLVVKRLWRAQVEAPELGVYSHRLGRFWLPGGASNAGGTVLSSFFTGDELAALSRRIDPERDSGLDYYPLPAAGERFPVCDPSLQPRLTPRPEAPERFLHGLFEGLARIERDGYRRLESLGVAYPRRVVTLGGGAANPVWARLRQRILGVPVEACTQEPCWGTARLARRGADWLESATR